MRGSRRIHPEGNDFPPEHETPTRSEALEKQEGAGAGANCGDAATPVALYVAAKPQVLQNRPTTREAASKRQLREQREAALYFKRTADGKVSPQLWTRRTIPEKHELLGEMPLSRATLAPSREDGPSASANLRHAASIGGRS